MSRYHMKHGGYSIGFPARQNTCYHPHEWESHFRGAKCCRVWNRFNVSSRRWHFWRSQLLLSLWPPGLDSRADISAAWPYGGVACISNRQQCSEFNLRSEYLSHSSTTMLGKLLCAKITHPSKVLPHKMDSGNSITTFSVTNLQCIAAATKVKVYPRSISSAISAPAISASQTHLLRMSRMPIASCTRNLVLDRPAIEYLWPWTQWSVDWQIGGVFCSLTASSIHSCSHSLFIVLITVFSTELVFSGSKTSSPSSTCSWTSLPVVLVFFSSSMISFSCSAVSSANKLIIRHSWNSSQCWVFHREATIWINTHGWNIINSILSIRTYINTSIILLPSILLSLLFSLSSTIYRTFRDLCIMTSSCSYLALTQRVEITFLGLITCLPISFPVTPFFSTNNIFTLCTSFNLKAFERQQLYKIWQYMGLLIICPCVCNPIYSCSNLCCSKVLLNIAMRMSSSFGRPFLLMKSTNASRCLPSVYWAWRCLGARMKS